MKRLEKKHQNLEQKHQQVYENFEILQTKVSLYEENPMFAKHGGRNDLEEYDLIGVDEL